VRSRQPTALAVTVGLLLKYTKNSPKTVCVQYIYISHNTLYPSVCDFGGLGGACWPLAPKFARSNPAEAVGFLGRKKSSARLPSEGK
jgi:hypothetical protein